MQKGNYYRNNNSQTEQKNDLKMPTDPIRVTQNLKKILK